jgi:plasmid stabilization system protein ParE
VYTIDITPTALADITEAVDYWNSKQTYLGYDFIDEVEKSFQSILLLPTGFSKRYKEVRGKLVKRFSYLILYQINDTHQTIEVLRIFNTYQQPFWK